MRKQGSEGGRKGLGGGREGLGGGREGRGEGRRAGGVKEEGRESKSSLIHNCRW